MTIRILQLPLGPLQTNCYVVACTKTNQAAIVDPAWDGRAILEHAKKNDWTVTQIWLTHAHFDHVGGLAELKELTGAPVFIHEEALAMLNQAPTAAGLWGFHIDPLPPVDHFILEDDTVEIGELRAQVLFTPGHAPGHVCFYLPGYKVLLDGDVLFQGSIGRTDLPGGDFDLLMRMINDKLMVLADDTMVLPGHGPVTTIGDERRTNPFLIN